MTTYTPAETFPPGEYLRDELEERGWTATEFAEIIGRPIQAVSEILNDKKEITTATALSFADALGTSAELWLNLQTTHRLHQQRSASPTDAKSDVVRRGELRSIIPLSQVRARGWVPDTKDLDLLESAVCELLDIRSLDERPGFTMAAKRSNSSEPLSIQQIAWLGRITQVARSQRVDTYDRSTLEELAARLPKLLVAGADALSKVPPLLAECGVRVVFCEGLRGGKLDGAVSVVQGGGPVIGLTTRGNRFDGLLFTLLHECAHLVLRHLRAGSGAIVDLDVMEWQEDPNERAANALASDWLFPGGFYSDGSSVASIVEAAERYGVHPSVVVGRVQRDSGNWSRFRNQVPKVRQELSDAGLLI